MSLLELAGSIHSPYMIGKSTQIGEDPAIAADVLSVPFDATMIKLEK
jgi:hypothetical protein